MSSGIKSLLSPRGITKTSQTKKQSLVSSLRTPSRSSIPGHLNQSSSQILFKSPGYLVEHFGTQLPVLITEALKFSDGNSAVSVNISSDGWAWFVCGRRLLVWQACGGRPVITQCRELSLPPSDLAHRAHLVTVYSQQASQMPSCLAVSPEGVVRYWSSIAHESSWTEANADLQGQECDSLHWLPPLGALLVTTTATLVLVTPHFAAARHALLCRTLKAPHGWLGGISRRVSSLIFGSIPASQILETKLVKVVTAGSQAGEWTVTVLAGHSLQKWQLCSGEMEAMLFEADLARPLREAFAQADRAVQELLLLDMQATEGGVMLLVAALQDSSHVTYALVVVRTESAPLSVSWFRELTADDLGPLARAAYGNPDSAVQFLLAGRSALIFNSSHVLAVPVLSGKGEIDYLDFGPGQIVGGALYGHSPVLFSTFNGFLSITSTESSEEDISFSINETMPEPSISESNIEELTQQKDNIGLLKAAFLLYIRKRLAQSKAAVANLFSGESGGDSTLDSAVTRTSLEMINDVPAKDPRWADQKSTRLSIGSSNSLQILHQLEEKQRVLQWYASFLKDLQLWDKLGPVSHAGRQILTTYLLQEHAEKVVATIALKKAHQRHPELVDKIIEEVLLQHSKIPFGSLTNQDIFYCQVSLVHEAIQQLVKWSEDVVYSEQNSHLVATQLISANSVLLDMVKAISELQERVGVLYQPTRPGTWEKKLWTIASGPEAIGDSLVLQMQLTVTHGVKTAGDPQLRAELLDQLVGLVDFVLAGRRSHVESLRDSPSFSSVLQQYETDRTAYIQLFMSEDEYERAAMLAEKYFDFQTLIEICQQTNNKEKLNSYIEKFNNQGFSKQLFSWYLRERREAALVQHCEERGGEALAEQLRGQPSLWWLHCVAQRQYKPAADSLRELASEETQLLQRKKTQLSLAKLALLASAEPSPDADVTIRHLDSQLALVAFQEHLPQSVLAFYGYDSDTMRLFSPSELVKLYISDENAVCTELTFKTALDILSYIEDDQEKSELSDEIWCKAMLKDSWTDMNPNTPPSGLQQLFFFKLVDLCILEGCEDLVPTIDSLLTCEELGSLKENRTFHYLLQVGYEHFAKDSVMAAL